VRLIGGGARCGRQKNDDLVAMNAAELPADLFVQNVGVDILALDERETALPLRALKLQEIALKSQSREFLLIFFAGPEAALSVDAVPDKIPSRRRRYEAKREGE
jgi:hypothetical protein